MKVATQLVLPEEVRTRCGYCNRHLVTVYIKLRGGAQARAYECQRCAPLLSEIETPADWHRFLDEARKDRAA